MKSGEFTAEINGLRLWYKVEGSGPACILPSPGWGLSVDEYIESLRPLAERLTMVFLDSRGSGRSEAPKFLKGYGYSDFARDIDGLRKTLGQEKVWVLGHSLGGVLAMRFALEYPDHCAGLILLDTYVASDAVREREMGRVTALFKDRPWFGRVKGLIEGERAFDDDADFTRWVVSILPLYFWRDEKLSSAMKFFEAGSCRLHAWRGWKESENAAVCLLDRIGEIGAPTLLVVGAYDFVCPATESRRIQAKIAGSELVEIDKAGHFPWMEDPETFFSTVKGYLARRL